VVVVVGRGSKFLAFFFRVPHVIPPHRNRQPYLGQVHLLSLQLLREILVGSTIFRPKLDGKIWKNAIFRFLLLINTANGWVTRKVSETLVDHIYHTNVDGSEIRRSPGEMKITTWSIILHKLPFPQLVNAGFLNHQQYVKFPGCNKKAKNLSLG